MATTPVSPSGPPTLREAINAAAAGDIISLVDGTYASIRSLAKQTSVPDVEVVQASGYAVTGASEAFTIIRTPASSRKTLMAPSGLAASRTSRWTTPRGVPPTAELC